MTYRWKILDVLHYLNNLPVPKDVLLENITVEEIIDL